MSDLPDPSPEFAAIGAILAALEELHPGIAERARQIDEDECSQTQVVRIRGPKMAAAARAAIAAGVVWLGFAATLADARRGWYRRRKLEKR